MKSNSYKFSKSELETIAKSITTNLTPSQLNDIGKGILNKKLIWIFGGILSVGLIGGILINKIIESSEVSSIDNGKYLEKINMIMNNLKREKRVLRKERERVDKEKDLLVRNREEVMMDRKRLNKHDIEEDGGIIMNKVRLSHQYEDRRREFRRSGNGIRDRSHSQHDSQVGRFGSTILEEDLERIKETRRISHNDFDDSQNFGIIQRKIRDFGGDSNRFHDDNAFIEDKDSVFYGSIHLFKDLLEKVLKNIPSIFSSNEWELVTEQFSTVIEKLSVPYNNCDIIRGTKTITTTRSAFQIINRISDICKYNTNLMKEAFKEAEPNYVYYKNVYWLNRSKTSGICHSRYSANSYFVTDRDYLFVRDVKKLSDNVSVYYGCSIPNNMLSKDWMSDSSCVRGEILLFAWRAEKMMNSNTVKVEFVQQIDPKGWISTKLLNKMNIESALSCHRYLNLQKFNSWIN